MGWEVRRVWLCAYTAVVVATLCYFMPLIRAYPQAVIPSPYPDALEFVWTTWRMQGVIDGSKQLYFTTELFAPSGASLLLHTVCEGLLVPITFFFPALDPIWRFNVAVILAFLLNGCAAVSLLRAVGARAFIASVGGLAISFAPHQVGHLTAGHLNFLVLFPLLELCRALVMIGRGDRKCIGMTRVDLVRCIIAVALMGRTNLYFLYYTVLLSIAFSLWWMVHAVESRAKLMRLWSLVLLGCVCNATHLYRIAMLARSKHYTPDHDPGATSADLIAYLVPSSLQRLGVIPEIAQLRAGVVFHEGETSLYIGLTLLLVLVVIVWSPIVRRAVEVRLFVGLAGLAMLASFGPWLTVYGEQRVWNPCDATLRALLPFYPSVPARWGLFVAIFLVCAVVAGLQAQLSRGRRAVIVLGMCLILVELCPIRCNVTQLVPTSPALERLRDDQGVRVIVDQSIISQHAMLRQTVHGKSLVGGFLSRRPRAEERQLRRNAFIQLVSASEREHSVEELREAWCALHADAVVLEAALAERIKLVLQTIGLTMADGDGIWSIAKPGKDLCGATG